MEQEVIQLISEILQPQPAKISDTIQFKGVPHDEILYAYKYWLEYLQLLIKEPFLVEMIQGRQDAGVDLIVRFLKTEKKIGLQVKSYQDLGRENFQQEVMSQISHSRKHGLEKLLVIPCGDLNNKSHASKIPNLMSNIDQMNDNYTIVIQPQFALPILKCYKNKKHPFNYLGQSKKILSIIEGLGTALSTDEYVASINVKFNYKNPPRTKDGRSLILKFRSFHSEKPENPLDKFMRLSQLGESVNFSKQEIKEIVVKHEDGRIETFEPSSFTLFKEKQKIGPLEFYAEGNEIDAIRNVILELEKSERGVNIFKSTSTSYPWVMELTVQGNNVTQKFSLLFSMTDFKHIAITQRFFMALKKSGKLLIKILPTNEILQINMDTDVIPTYSEESLKRMENIEFLQDKLSQRINYTMDSSLINMPLINELVIFIKNKKIEKSSLSFPIELSKKDASEILKEFKEKSFLESYELIGDPMMVEIMGENMEIGKVKVTMKKVMIEDNIKEIESKLKEIDDDAKIQLTIISNGESKDVYELIKLPLEK